LNNATNCGIAVIFTLRAATAPITEPTTSAIRIKVRFFNSIPEKNRTPVPKSRPLRQAKHHFELT